jgi:predicted nuclease of predicted toxin-antitoxin system
VRLLIDENVSPIVGDALRMAGYDVSVAAVDCPGARDESVVSLAISEGRTIVSEDKDFGDLAFRTGLRPPGLVRIALPGYPPPEKAVRVVDALRGRNATGVILVIEPTRVRRRRLP